MIRFERKKHLGKHNFNNSGYLTTYIYQFKWHFINPDNCSLIPQLLHNWNIFKFYEGLQNIQEIMKFAYITNYSDHTSQPKSCQVSHNNIKQNQTDLYQPHTYLNSSFKVTAIFAITRILELKFCNSLFLRIKNHYFSKYIQVLS